jgi:hypothetical protein
VAEGKNYSRERNGKRFLLKGGLNTVKALDLLTEGEYAYIQNVRALIDGRIVGRPTTDAVVDSYGASPHTIVRMNDFSPLAPVAGFVRMVGEAGVLCAEATNVASGFSGNPLSILPFGPNQSVQPWAYVGDSSQAVTITATGQSCTGMVKVRSDGLARKTGIKEPQTAPIVSVNTSTVTEYLSLPANTPPWTNIGGANPDYNYTGTDARPPFPTSIPTPISGATVTLTVTGTATVNGTAGTGPGHTQPSTATYPGHFITTPVTVVFAFTDANGNIVAQPTGGTPPVVGNVGTGATLTVPPGAAQLQLGIDSAGGSFAANSGSYLVTAVISTSAITTAVATVGQVTAYVWGDSPHTGPTAGYIWKNPNDGGTGIARTIGTAQATANNNSWIFDSSPEDGTVPVAWTTLDSTGSSIGTIDLFNPAFESEGYQDFNACIVGSIFVPAPGTYNVQCKYKDQIMVGVGGGVTSSVGTVTGLFGQTITVVDSLPLMFVSTPDGAGGNHTTTFALTFPAMGIYQFEIDWDYWYHSGRVNIMEMAPTPSAGVAVITPEPQGVRTNVVYWYKYRASESGAPSNQSPPSTEQLTPVLANTVASAFSADPQVDKVDYYRQDKGLVNPTYVATGPNDGMGGTIGGIVYNTAITDTLTDLAAAANDQMQVDDFEPFPSIDVPHSGMVTIVDGVITWKSGDKFNVRWLPGTIILIGSPTQQAYSLIARPTSATTMVIPSVPDNIGDAGGGGVPYNIAQPFLAQQPLPSMWGPDAYGFMHAVGDTNQPEAYCWTKAYNPDSAPQTNRLLLTSPSEPLMGGGIVNGISMTFSTERAWLMYPNFADAQATVTGTVGNQWNPIPAAVKRGLYIRNCLCTLGGKAIAYRGSDGIYLTSGGAEQSLTDETIWNLFPHEGPPPANVVIGPYTVSPPDDTRQQTLAYQSGYIYFDYRDTSNNPHTLVYDEKGKGWSVDVGSPTFTCHSAEYAPGVNDTAVGCSDHTLRILQTGGSEAAVSVVATGADNAGEARAFKRVGDVFIKALINASKAVTPTLYTAEYATALAGFGPATLTGTGKLAPYILDWTSGQPQDVTDLELIVSWATNSANELDLWQPSWLSLPENTQDRASDWTNLGSSGSKLIQGLTLELNTFNVPKTFSVQDDAYVLHTPLECPVTANGQTVSTFTFNPQFTSHQVRIVTTDGVPWQAGPTDGWILTWDAQPYPSGSTVWIAEASSFGLTGYGHCFGVNLAYICSAPVTVKLTTDQGTFTLPNFPATSEPAHLPAKIFIKAPPNKWKTCIFSATSEFPVYLWKELTEAWIGAWGRAGNYSLVRPFGGESNPEGGAAI